MAITFDTQILPLYVRCIETDPNYENVTSLNEQRLLLTLEVIRAYIDTIHSAQEAKVFHSCISKILSSIPTGVGTGAGFPASQVATLAMQRALTMFGRAARPLPAPQLSAPQPSPVFELIQETIVAPALAEIIEATEIAPDEILVDPESAAKKPAAKRRKKTEALA